MAGFARRNHIGRVKPAHCLRFRCGAAVSRAQAYSELCSPLGTGAVTFALGRGPTPQKIAVSLGDTHACALSSRLGR